MAEGDSILRAARRMEASLQGRRLSVRAPSPRGKTTGVERLDGLLLTSGQARGKNLLLRFEGGLVLHSHLGMSGAWHLYRSGERWRRSERRAWAVLAADDVEAVQFDGPTLRGLTEAQARRDPRPARLRAEGVSGGLRPPPPPPPPRGP